MGMKTAGVAQIATIKTQILSKRIQEKEREMKLLMLLKLRTLTRVTSMPQTKGRMIIKTLLMLRKLDKRDKFPRSQNKQMTLERIGEI